MTQEQIDHLIALSAPLLDAPLPWNQLSPEQQSAFRALMPNPSFTSQQRYWIVRWWLPVTEQQVDDLNALCPANTAIAPREDINGEFLVSCDLLSDALDGGRLAELLPLLETLPLTCKQPEEWPTPDPEGEI